MAKKLKPDPGTPQPQTGLTARQNMLAVSAIEKVPWSLGERIVEAREKRGLQQNELAELMGVTPQAVSQWEGNTTQPKLANMAKLAEHLNVDQDWLLTGEITGRLLKQFAHLQAPLLSRVAAGEWDESCDGLAAEQRMLDLLFPAKGRPFGLEIDGESMSPEFSPGDIVIIDTGLEPVPGDYVVAKLDAEERATFKRFRPRGLDENNQPIIELAPLNPDYPSLFISARSPGRIVGVMIEHRRYRRRR